MNYERKKIQHEILKFLEKRYFEFVAAAKTPYKFDLAIDIETISNGINQSKETTLAYCFELDSINLIRYSKGTFPQCFFITDPAGLTAASNNQLLNEYDILKLDNDVANSVITTNRNQKILGIATLLVAIFASWVAYQQFIHELKRDTQEEIRKQHIKRIEYQMNTIQSSFDSMRDFHYDTISKSKNDTLK